MVKISGGDVSQLKCEGGRGMFYYELLSQCTALHCCSNFPDKICEKRSWNSFRVVGCIQSPYSLLHLITQVFQSDYLCNLLIRFTLWLRGECCSHVQYYDRLHYKISLLSTMSCRQVRQHLRQVRAISVWTLDLPVVTDLQTQITILEVEGGGS